MTAIGEIKRDGVSYGLGKYFAITEDMVTVTTDSTKGVSPYNTSYGYTNITISEDAGISWIEGATYTFVVDTKMVVASAYRNVRVRIGTSGSRKPLMTRTSSILAGSSYLLKTNTRLFVYKSVYQSGGALHLNQDTTYSAMSVAEGQTGTATSGRVMRADYLKQIIQYHAGALDPTAMTQTEATTGTSTTAKTISPKILSDTIDEKLASAGGGNMNAITEFGRTWRFGTKAMFKALTNKDVNGVYVILSQKDYNKMIND